MIRKKKWREGIYNRVFQICLFSKLEKLAVPSICHIFPFPGRRSKPSQTENSRERRGHARAKSGQDSGHHHWRLFSLLASFLRHRFADVTLSILRSRAKGLLTVPVAGIREFHSQSSDIHRLQSRFQKGIRPATVREKMLKKVTLWVHVHH